MNGSTVLWTQHLSTASLPTTFISSTELTATVSATDIQTFTSALISVQSPGPGGGVLKSNQLTFLVTEPTSSLVFRLSTQSPSAGNHPNVPVFADLNGDGIIDLAVSNQSEGMGNVSIFYGLGGGAFSAATNYPVANGPEGMAVGDFNNDGYPDLAVADMNNSSYSILLGSASGTFTVTTTNFPVTGTFPYAVVTGDFNQDGILDLAFACQDPSTGGFVYILLGNGDGTFGTPQHYGSLGQPEGLVAADFNGDGFLDLAVSDFQNSDIWILTGNGDGTFSSGTPYSAAPASGVAGLAASDFNGDGQIDLAVSDLTTGGVTVFLNSSGTFSQSSQSPISVPGGYFLGAADLNGNGIADLAVADYSSNTFNELLGNGDGTFQTPVSFTVDPNATSILGLALADVASNGRIDVVTTDLPDQEIPEVEVLLQTAQLNPNPSSLTFPNTNVGATSAAMTTTLENTGSAPLVIRTISSTDSEFAETNTCGTLPVTLWVGASCTVSVTFAPSTYGTRSGSISIDDNASETAQTVPLSGVGDAPEASISPMSLSFGNQLENSTSSSQMLTLSNTGNASLSIGPITISGTGYKYFTVASNNCGTSLAAGASCLIGVTFDPAAGGSFSPTLTVSDNSNGSSGASQPVSLSGTGVAPSAALGPATLTFGSQLVGTSSATQSLTLTNSGTYALTISSIAITNSDFSQTNNCGSSLAAGASCAITVTFKPPTTGTLNGSLSATLTVTDNTGGVNGSTQTTMLTGMAAAPVASVPASLPAFPATLVGTSSAAQPVTVTNTGGATLSITSIAIGGTNAGDFSQTNNCGTSLAAGLNCSINVTFKPTATGTMRSATLTLTDNNNEVSGSTQVATLTGTAVAPVASLPTSVPAFAATLVGSSTSQSVTLSNGTGSAALTISSIVIGGANAGDFSQTNNCGTSVAAGASCSITVTFKPAATGSRSGSITVTDNTGGVSGSAQVATLTGTGTAPVASLTPSTLPAFAATVVGTTSAAQTVTLSNPTGTAPLTISAIVPSGDFAESNTCGALPAQLAVGASCSISVTFAPTAAGARSGTLTITDNNNAVSGSTQIVSLTGEGTQAAVTLSASSIAFGNENVGTASVLKPVTITNSGNATLTITGITVSGDYTVSNPCGSSLAAGANCTVNVTFKPTAIGSRTGDVTVTDNAATSTQTVSLSGTGLGATVSLSKSSLTFAGELVGVASAPQTVTVTNTGNAALALTSVAASGAWSQTNTCGSSVAAGASCNVSVVFTAKAGGAAANSLTLTDNAVGSASQTISLSGTGQDFSLTAASTSASLSAGQTATYNLTLTPSGGLNEAVSLTCTGLTSSSESSCTVSPASVTPTGPTPITVTVTTTAPSHVLPLSRPTPQIPGGRVEWMLIALLGLAGMTWLARRRPQAMPVRLRLALVTACIAVLLALGLAGCGSSSNSTVTTQSGGTPTGNYSITVTGTATSGSVTDSHNVALTMTVQ